MNPKWKKNKKLKPDIILEKINKLKKLENDKVSFESFEFDYAMSALYSMIDYPSNLIGLNKESVTINAIFKIAKDGELKKETVLKEIQKNIKRELNNPEKKFSVLTTISIKKPSFTKRQSIDGCSILFYENYFPQKYNGREEIIKDLSLAVDATPQNYSKVVIHLKEKNTNAAFTKALESLDILRAIWCLFFNPITEWYSLLFGKQWVPINTIRLGGVHTIHDAKGKLCSEKVWYEPNFCKTTPYQPNQSGPFCNDIKWALESLNSSKYKSVIRDSMLRYVRALDERDQNVAIIRLWNALEILASPNEGNFDKISKRCSFLFAERNYHEQVIEHLREYRNRNVHSGDQDENSKNICYQIQYYYSQLILFHLRNASFFNCLEEANSYLDLPSNLISLNKRKNLIEKAINFVSPKDSK